MKFLPVALAIAASCSLVAQNPGAAKKAEPSVERRAQSMRDDIDAGRHLKSHVRVSVRLKNGNRLQGVVKDGRLVERVDGLRFVDASAKEEGAGIRLWYSSGARNYVFVPFSSFAEYEVLQRLTSEQLEEIEHELQRDEARRAAAKEQGQKEPAPPADATPAPAVEGETPAAAPAPKGAKSGKAGAEPKVSPETELQRLWFSLVQTYPPSAGWNAAKRDEIARRQVVIGAKPSALELAFVEKFADWQKAVAHFDLAPKAEATEQPKEEPSARRSSRR